MKIFVALSLWISCRKTPFFIYALHRRVFAWTNGYWNDLLSFFLSKTKKKVALGKVDGVLHISANENISDVLDSLDRNGFYIFNELLDGSFVDDIIESVKDVAVRYVTHENGIVQYSSEKISYNQFKQKDSPRCQMDVIDIYNNKLLSKLIFDKSLLKIAQEYLKCRPVMDILCLWRSHPSGNKGLMAGAAQKFHFDMDRIKFIKFFFYLTDVTLDNGPHCFVKGSHKRLSKKFRSRGRFEDHDVESFYGKENILHLKGRKGTIMAVDTRGLHKGIDLRSGERVIFQVQYSNSMFGHPYDKIGRSQITVPEVHDNLERYPLVYAPGFKK